MNDTDDFQDSLSSSVASSASSGISSPRTRRRSYSTAESRLDWGTQLFKSVGIAILGSMLAGVILTNWETNQTNRKILIRLEAKYNGESSAFNANGNIDANVNQSQRTFGEIYDIKKSECQKLFPQNFNILVTPTPSIIPPKKR